MSDRLLYLSQADVASVGLTMACNLGLALDDMATAPLIYRRAVEQGVGTWLPL